MGNKWPGPYHGGITQSLISKFLECPYRFYIYAVLGLQESSALEPNLAWGDVFHKGLEHLIEKTHLRKTFTDDDWLEIYDAVDAYVKKAYPSMPLQHHLSVKQMLQLYDDTYKLEHGPFDTEVKFQQEYRCGEFLVTLRGKLDGLNHDKTVMVEHKCKGKVDGRQHRIETPHDLQVNLYSLVNGPKRVIYDVIKIPDAQYQIPGKRLHQTMKNYVESLYLSAQGYGFPVVSNRNLWLDQFHVMLREDEQQQWVQETLNPLIRKMCVYWDYVNQSGFDFENPKYYNEIFYKTPIRHFDPSKTEKYKCSYHSLLTGQLTFNDLIPVDSFYPELDEKAA